MIEPHLYATFVGATVLLMLIPGPNLTLIVANSIAHGTRAGLLTVSGTASAMVIQLSLVALGMTELLGNMAYGFELLRWIGVAYLIYLGVQQWRARPVDVTVFAPPRAPHRKIFARAMLVSLTNPKTLLFFGAFFPQFISTAPGRAIGPQVGVLAVTFVTLAVVIDSCWAMLAARARGIIGRHGRLKNRISGTLLIGAGLGLAAVRNR